MGVINHRKQPKKPLSEKQVQADLLGHMKYLLRTLQARISFTHVYGHNKLNCDNMNEEQQLNTRNDKDTGEVLEKAVENKEFITHDFPHERIRMECGSKSHILGNRSNLWMKEQANRQSTISWKRNCRWGLFWPNILERDTWWKQDSTTLLQPSIPNMWSNVAAYDATCTI